MKLKKAVFCLFISCIANAVKAQTLYSIYSPDKKIEVRLTVADSISYEVLFNNIKLIEPSPISIKTDFLKNEAWEVFDDKETSTRQILYPVVWQKNQAIQDSYNQLQLDFKNDISLQWRAYNNGVAWRWIIHKKGPYKILNEQASFDFHKTDSAWYPSEKDFYSPHECTYNKLSLDDIGPEQLSSLPALFDVKGTKVLITESDLFNYAGMWIHGGNKKGEIEAAFPNYPKVTKVTSDIDEKVLERDDFIAKCNGAKTFPWRIVMIAPNDRDLLTNQLVYQLASPSKGNYNWIVPGKASWDWWNGQNLTHVNFHAGNNMQTYEYYIDFASRYGLKYFVVDGGWSDDATLMKPKLGINMQELSDYARKRNVGLILWASWLTLNRQLEPAINQFAQWGIKGIKVDFMQRDDQQMVNFFERVAKATAQEKMIVDFHGARLPAGIYRTYPNVITSEGVYGAEYLKWDTTKRISPDHNVTLPFIRMVAGPMDYTPGAMLNAQKNSWAPFMDRPMSMGTRCHQLAMYVIYESPLQMLADSPSNYYKEPGCMEFLKEVPVEWQKTLPLQAKVGNYVLIARKAKNGDWYIGAMTDWSPRKLSFDLSFLGNGKYTMQLWKDGMNANKNAQDYKMENRSIDSKSVININLAKGGGWVARISK